METACVREWKGAGVLGGGRICGSIDFYSIWYEYLLAIFNKLACSYCRIARKRAACFGWETRVAPIGCLCSYKVESTSRSTISS